jgi:hypothetical protein
MSRKIGRLLALVLLCGAGQAGLFLRADEPVKTSEKRDTLLYVRTDPPGAKVLLNGKELGVSNGLFNVEPGSGTILIELEGRKPDQRQVIIRANAVTRVELSLEPQAKVKSARTTRQPPDGELKPVFVTVGPTFFRSGDSITLTEVKAASPALRKGDKVIVKGYYTLASKPQASLCLFATSAKASGPSPIQPEQRINVARGQGRFELSETLDCIGYLHLTFYSIPAGESFGGLYFGTAKQMNEIAHWDVHAWYTSERKPQANVEAQSGPFIGRLPQGTVELVGITKYRPTAGPRWWRPDGSAVQLGPFQPKPSHYALSRDKNPLTFLYRYKDLPGNASRVCAIQPRGNWVGAEVLDAHGEIVPNYDMLSVQFDTTPVTANLRIGVSMGAWETAIKQKADSPGTSNFSRDGRQWSVTFHKATVDTSADTTKVTLTDSADYGQWDERLVAVASDGSELVSSIGYFGRHGTAVFDLPLSSIKEFLFQVRPYSWVEFKNISLQAGQKTDVEVVSPNESTGR